MVNLAFPAVFGAGLVMWVQIGTFTAPSTHIARLERIAEQAEKAARLSEDARRQRLLHLLTGDYDACRLRSCSSFQRTRNATAVDRISSALSSGRKDSFAEEEKGLNRIKHLRFAQCSAACDQGGSDADALAAALLEWIASTTGLAAPNPPRIVLASPRHLAQLYDAGKPGKPFALHAFYSNSVIYLPDDWKPLGNGEMSALLHELVHHVQRLNNIEVECPAARERQAYDLQARWLREQGEDDPFKIIGMDEFTIAMLYSCPDVNNRP